MDEIWGYVGKKEKHVRLVTIRSSGNVWTFCAIDADTKLVPAFKVGRIATVTTANAFVADVADRMRNGYRSQPMASRLTWSAIDGRLGQCGLRPDHQDLRHRGVRRSTTPLQCPEDYIQREEAVFGRPDVDLISTSYVERLNATTRLHMKRLARLTHAFSKKRENFEAAVGLHFAYYNFVRRHNTLRCTPAMAAGVEQSFWSVGELLEATA